MCDAQAGIEDTDGGSEALKYRRRRDLCGILTDKGVRRASMVVSLNGVFCLFLNAPTLVRSVEALGIRTRRDFCGIKTEKDIV